MTPAVRQHVHNLARAVLVRKAPILLQASLWQCSCSCSCSFQAGWPPFTVLQALVVPYHAVPILMAAVQGVTCSCPELRRFCNHGPAAQRRHLSR